ncbi:MAG: hypothetical protein AMXMBFR44_4750 [Candidatus Campbellbacteria bacterium]
MKRSILLSNTYLLTFLLSFHAYLFLYINGSILEEHMSVRSVGLLFSLAALLSIPVLLYLPHALKLFGSIRFTALALLIEGLALFGLTFAPSVALIALSFIAHYVLVRVLFFDTDIILETLSFDAETGRLRGIFMAAGNTALLLSPLFVGLLLDDGTEYTRIFFASLFALVPAVLLLLFSFRGFKDSTHTRLQLIPALRSVWRHPALRNIFSANLVLRMFYAAMVVYTGLYLHQSMGMSWEKIGIAFTVMLIPFAVLEYPLGRLADTRFGEKEIMFGGFLMTALATALVTWVTSGSVLVWSLVLLATRIGAAAVEIMTETYFFKHVSKDDVETVSLYRIVEPMGYIVAPLIFSVFLTFIDMRFIFLVLGLFVLSGLIPTLRLRDTK